LFIIDVITASLFSSIAPLFNRGPLISLSLRPLRRNSIAALCLQPLLQQNKNQPILTDRLEK